MRIEKVGRGELTEQMRSVKVRRKEVRTKLAMRGKVRSKER